MHRLDFSKPALTGPSKAEVTRRIKQWVAGMQVLGADGVVHLAELQCHEPGCPDFETVITLMGPKHSQDRTVKVFKPLAEVKHDEVIHAVLKSFADGSPAIAALNAESEPHHTASTTTHIPPIPASPAPNPITPHSHFSLPTSYHV